MSALIIILVLVLVLFAGVAGIRLHRRRRRGTARVAPGRQVIAGNLVKSRRR